jgi:hypothetical protein
MHYLIIDSGMPQPHSIYIWSPIIENAVQFSSAENAEATRNNVPDATGVIEANGGWYVVKE